MKRRTFLHALTALGLSTALRSDNPAMPLSDRLNDPHDMDRKIFGMALGSWWWAHEDAASLDAYLHRTADPDCSGKGFINFVQVHFTYELPDIRRPEIVPLGDWQPDRPNHQARMDRNIARTIRHAHDLGLGVLLKPHLAPRIDGRLVDRARIDYGGDGRVWDAFFSNYTRIMRHYARLAQEHDVEIFAYACELQGTLHRTQNWRLVIDAIRDEGFTGSLAYTGLKTRHRGGKPHVLGDDDANRIIEQSDYVCPHLYGPLGSAQDWSVARLRDDFAKVISMYERIADLHRKTILVTETGMRPIRAQSASPWRHADGDTPQDADIYDERMQTRWTDAVIRDSLSSSLVKGVFWWDAVSDYRPRALGEKHLRRAWRQMICR